MDRSTVVVAGATGNLGGRIVARLRAQQAPVTALVRAGAAADRLARLEALGATLVRVDPGDRAALATACRGAACVVSALAGLREVVVEVQSTLLDAAVDAGVARFIPSDYSIDFTRLPAGRNRNLDLRREFHRRLEAAPIAATSIFCGAFADMLTGRMPLILFDRRRVLVWGNPDQRMDFTTMDDTAEFTAHAALDPDTPRFLRIAGDRLTARDLAAVAGEVAGKRFRLLRPPGGPWMLSAMIAIARRVAPGEDQLYPPWQGMQYMRDMLDGRGLPPSLDNDRYPGLRWTQAREVLAAGRR